MKYWQRRRQERLYKQWTKHAELPPEAIPTPEVPEQAGMPADIEPTYDDARLGLDARKLVEDRGLWYRFRLLLVDVVRKILRVD